MGKVKGRPGLGARRHMDGGIGFARTQMGTAQYWTMSESEKQAVVTKGAPAAIGPYSQAVRVGDLLFTSGQIALEPATGAMVEDGVEAQTVRVCENLKAVLEAAGAGFSQVVKTTVFLKSMGDFAAMNGVYGRYFAPEGAVAPARSTVEVARLPKDALVEIELIAQLG